MAPYASFFCYLWTYNSYIMQHTLTLSFWVYSQTCATITIIQSSKQQYQKLMSPIGPYPPPLAATDLVSESIDLPILGI